MKFPLLLLCLLWSLAEVHSQTAPYVSFMGETLPNHAYVNLSLVGDDDNSSVQCHTDLDTRCQGTLCGDWIPPGREERLPSSNDTSAGIYEHHRLRRVDLRRRNNTDKLSGIYRCDIATYVDTNTSVGGSVYVGLYASGGNAAT